MILRDYPTLVRGTTLALQGGEPMLLRSIRAQLLGLVLAAALPLTALIAIGLWSQWRSDHAAARDRALNDARLLAAQVDDHIGNLVNLLNGLSRAVSSDPADAGRNDALLRRVRRRSLQGQGLLGPLPLGRLLWRYRLLRL
jgi:cytochrome c-type biogenesis protein CcmH/NrfG